MRLIDSHTGGEPTRIVLEGLPDPGSGSISERLHTLKLRFDRYRTAVIGEPRSSPVAVGGYLLPSSVADFGVIFFNNAGYLGMCGHGTIGLVATLAHLGRISLGLVTFETPAGLVSAELHADGSISFDNVPSFRYRKDVIVDLGQGERTKGDIAYGGNWFFVSSSDHGLVSEGSLSSLEARCAQIQRAIDSQGIRGDGDAPIDHIELVGESMVADSKNYVRCPGGEYDRSPCGTGTSAKLACMFADGKLAEGQIHTVESTIGSTFEGSVRTVGDKVIPRIKGRAFVNGESTILIDPNDPFAWGIP